jgi:hypothetical protein
MVEEQGFGVTKAAKQLRVKLPTAKVILSNYRKKGHIYTKKSDKAVETPKASEPTPVVKEEEVVEQPIEITQK